MSGLKAESLGILLCFYSELSDYNHVFTIRDRRETLMFQRVDVSKTVAFMWF